MTEPTALLGNTLSFTTPSKFQVQIRETNGEDDETISKLKNAMDGTSIDKLLAGIILDNSKTKSRLSPEEIMKWRNNDRYYTIFKSRLFSLGSEITYSHKCTGCGKTKDWDEDLTQYDRDFSKPDKESDNKFKYQVQPYPDDKLEAEFSISSGKKFKYMYSNGEVEKSLLDIDKNEISMNTKLTVRKLSWWNEDKWMPLSSFRNFSSKEMTEIRKEVGKDDNFEAVSECKCPSCGVTDKISLMLQPGFFFPGEI